VPGTISASSIGVVGENRGATVAAMLSTGCAEYLDQDGFVLREFGLEYVKYLFFVSPEPRPSASTDDSGTNDSRSRGPGE
jgi:hypothetical protein